MNQEQELAYLRNANAILFDLVNDSKMTIQYCKDDFEIMLGKKLSDDKYEEMREYIERKIDVWEIVQEYVRQYDERML